MPGASPFAPSRTTISASHSFCTHSVLCYLTFCQSVLHLHKSSFLLLSRTMYSFELRSFLFRASTIQYALRLVLIFYCPSCLQPKTITDVKDFLQKARRADVKGVKIKKNRATGITKFKIRCSKYLYTYVVQGRDKADKLTLSLPPGLSKKEIE